LQIIQSVLLPSLNRNSMPSLRPPPLYDWAAPPLLGAASAAIAQAERAKEWVMLAKSFLRPKSLKTQNGSNRSNPAPFSAMLVSANPHLALFGRDCIASKQKNYFEIKYFIAELRILRV
jgi:hypothetical protein